jgi:hypothetical protein
MTRTLLLFPLMVLLLGAAAFADQNCVSCHKQVTPSIVSDWQCSGLLLRSNTWQKK